MGFLRFLDRKKERESETVLSRLSEDRFSGFDRKGSGIGGLGELRLPPLPPLDNTVESRVPEEIESPFESNNDLDENITPNEQNKLFPSLLKEPKSLESELGNGVKGESKAKEIVNPKPSNDEGKLEDLERLEFPDMSLVPDEFRERIGEDIRDTRRELLQNKTHTKIKEMHGPLFVNLNGFNDLVMSIDSIKGALKECDLILKNTLVMKEKQDHKLIQWQEEFHDIERKLLYCDKVLFETKHY